MCNNYTATFYPNNYAKDNNIKLVHDNSILVINLTNRKLQLLLVKIFIDEQKQT